MAGIREIARQYRDEIMDGIAWVAIWKTGRSWNARAFWLNTDSDMFEDEDIQEVRDIVAADANAIFINEYYCAHMGEGKLDDIVAGIRFFYEKRWNTLEESIAYRMKVETTEQEEQEEIRKESKGMNCWDCRYQNGCSGATCYYDHLQEQREAQPDYDEEKYYIVDMCSRCAYTDKIFSKRGIDEYDRTHPENDMYSFMTKDEIEAKDGIRWDTKDSWLEDGKQDAVEIIGRKGIAEVFSWWKDFDAKQFVLKQEIGFYNEIMRQAEEAGLLPEGTRRAQA